MGSARTKYTATSPLDFARPFAVVTDLADPRSVATIARRRYGRIEASDGKFRAIRFRPWPKYISIAELWWRGRRTHERRSGDHCLMYFNQPWPVPAFLAVTYVVSTRGGSYASLRAALTTLNQIAQLKGTSAVVCEVSNRRISDRAMRRAGWERHVQSSRRRHFIRRY